MCKLPSRNTFKYHHQGGSMKVAALIPCRTGSKRIPNKNFKEFRAKPLWTWTYTAALFSEIFSLIVLSSDGGFDWHGQNGITVTDNQRPPELADDKATMEELLVHYMKEYPEYEIWCLLQPTSPLRTAEDIKNAYNMLITDERDSIVSVFNDPLLFWVKDCVDVQGQQCPVASFHIDKRPNSQDRQDWYKENGAIYFIPAYTLKSTGSRCGGRVGLYVMPKERSYEIDDPIDWEICEFLMKRQLEPLRMI